MQQQFKEWILQLDYEGIEITQVEENRIEIRGKHAIGKVNFYSMNIIELSADHLNTNESIFYLHFQLTTLQHAQELLIELIDCILSIRLEKGHKILFCCSSGLTTGFFAEKMNEACELLNYQISVDAVAIDRIYPIIDQYELVCIAPQIAYQLPELNHNKPHINFIKIPPQIFAKYDAGEMIKLILEKLEENKLQKITTPTSYQEITTGHAPILCLNIIRNSRRTHIIYAVYNESNFVIMDDEVIKPVIYLSDLYDAIDICLARVPEISFIGMSLPGIINKDRFISSNYVEGLNDHNLDDLFTNKYHRPFLFTNDANAAAVGFSATHPEYQSLSYIYQPLYYRPGIGNIVNGKLLVGAHHLSGEIKLLPMQLSKPFMELIQEKDGGIEIIAKHIIALITTIDPEAIVICSQLVNDISLIRNELIRLIEHEEYLPELILEENFHMYLFLGQLVLCIEAIQQEKQHL